MKIVVIVPVRDQPGITRRFLDCMRWQEFDELLILDNGCQKPTARVIDKALAEDPRLSVLDFKGLGIYEMWNQGFEHAQFGYREPVNVLISNNDVVLPRGGVRLLAETLEKHDDYWILYPDQDAAWKDEPVIAGTLQGRGVAAQGGLYGPCFMVASARLPWRPLITDPGYEWWFGDNHLARQVEEARGLHGRALGLAVQHENEGTARHHPETQGMRNRDRRRWFASQRGRPRLGSGSTRRTVPGTRVWAPGGKRIR
jgi:hypothetical protein